MRPRLLLVLASCLGAACAAACAPASPSHGKSDPGACATCHMPEYQASPRHVGHRPTTCGVCHLPTAWHPTTLDHPFWELTGAHAKAECFACHVGTPPVFHGTKKDCVGCHQPDYDKAPDHPGHFPTTCAECHTTAAWKPTLPRPTEPAAGPSAPSATTSPGEPQPKPGGEPTPKSPPKRAPKPTPKPAPSSSGGSAPPPDATSGASKRPHGGAR